MDLRLALIGEDKMSAAFDSAGAAARQALKLFIDFSTESVKAALSQEKADRQLAVAAKELTGVFKAQADAMQAQLGVNGEMVQQIQALLLQYGEAPDKVEATTRSILDFSAATGRDAVGATRELLKGIESGRGAFKEYGIQLDLTGKASADVVKATQALREKFGGAAQGEADSLEGQVRGLAVAFGELQENFGGWILGVAKSSGILDEFKKDMSELSSFFAEREARKTPDQADRLNELANIDKALAAYARGEISSESIDAGAKTKWELERRRRELSDQIQADELARMYPRVEGGEDLFRDRKTTAGTKKSKEAREFGYEPSSKLQEDDAVNAEIAQDKRDRSAAEDWLKSEADALKRHSEDVRRAGDAMSSVLKDQQDRLRADAKQWADAGEQIGSAFVNSLSSEIEKVAQGGEFDLGRVLGGILQTAFTAIGNMVLPGLGGLIGGALGGFANMAISGVGQATPGFHGISEASTVGKPTKHLGGWINVAMPRYHSGSWVGGDERPAILQTGERVLSRGEVSRMGGQAGVDAAARGGGGRGGGVTINVSSLDSRSTAEFFTDRGGKGLDDAVRTGQGPLAKLLGKGRLF